MKKRFSISTILLSLIAWFAIAPSLVSSAEQATLELVAGGGTTLEGKATKCKISQPFGIAFDAQDNMFICEETHRLLRVDAKTGDLTAVSKAGAKDDDIGDGKVAAKACFSAPHNLVSDAQGNLFIADTMHFRVRRVDAKMQMVTTIAGTGAKELSGDGGPATAAALDGIACICFNHDFTKLYLGGFSRATRVIDMRTGIIDTVKGLGGSRAVTVDSKGDVFVVAGSGLRMLDTAGRTHTLEDKSANPPLKGVKHLWADADDNILIADESNNLIRKFIVAENKLITIAGTGEKGDAGVPGPALTAEIGGPHGVVTNPHTGQIYIADSRNNRVLRLVGK